MGDSRKQSPANESRLRFFMQGDTRRATNRLCLREFSVFLFLLATFAFPYVQEPNGEASGVNARWQRIGPAAGTIQQIEPHRTVPGVVFAINNGRLYRSEDFGLHWKRLAMENVLQVTIHLRTKKIFVLARAGQGIKTSGIILVSTDTGNRFVLQANVDSPIRRVFIDPDDENVMFASGIGYQDLGWTTDGGRHWIEFANLPVREGQDETFYRFEDLLFSPFDSQGIFASGTVFVPHSSLEFIISSDNLGKTWKVVQWRFIRRSRGPYRFHQDHAFPDRAFAYSCSRGILKLTEQGWVRITDFGVSQLVSLPRRPKKLLAFPGCLDAEPVSSLDEGKSWRPIRKTLNGRITILAGLDDEVQTVLGGTGGGGVYRRQSRQDWSRSDFGMKEADIIRLASDARSKFLFCKSVARSDNSFRPARFLYRRDNSTSSWSNLSRRVPLKVGGMIRDIAVNPDDPQHVYLGVLNEFPEDFPVQVSFDGGRTWKESKFDQSPPSFVLITLDPSQSNVAYLNGFDILDRQYKIFKSVDRGITFQKLPIDFSSFRLRGRLLRIVLDQNNSNTMYFLFTSRRDQVLKSEDGGKTVDVAGPNAPDFPIAMAPLPGKDSYLLLNEHGRIFETTNGSRTWKIISRIPRCCFDSSSTALYPADKHGLHFFAILRPDRFPYQHALLESLDGGKSWTNITTDFGQDVEVFDMSDPRHHPFFVGTSSGVFAEQQ